MFQTKMYDFCYTGSLECFRKNIFRNVDAQSPVMFTTKGGFGDLGAGGG